MSNKFIASVFLAAASAAPVFATGAEPTPEFTFTGNAALSSEYIFRGIGQTDRKPAISGGVDLAHASGLYVGNWNSNISWLSDSNASVSSSIEMDFYGGYKGKITDALSYDIGDLYYYYPGRYPNGFTKPHTNEVYVALTFGPLTAKYSYATTNLFGTLTPSGEKTDGSGYIDLTYTGDLGNGLTLGAHVGHQTVKGFSDASYTDYKLGLTKDFYGYAVSAAFVGTNAKGNSGEFYHNAFDKDLGKNRLLVSVGKTF